MPRSLDSALEQERRQVERRVRGLVSDSFAVTPITEARSLRHFAENFRQAWEAEGELAAVSSGATEALEMYIDSYMKQVLESVGLWERGISEEAGIRTLTRFLRSSDDRQQLLEDFADASASFRWLIAEGLPRTQDMQTRLRVLNIEGLGKLVRLCDERLLALELAAHAEDDDWVYDSIEILALELKQHDLLRQLASERIEVDVRKIMEGRVQDHERGTYQPADLSAIASLASSGSARGFLAA